MLSGVPIEFVESSPTNGLREESQINSTMPNEGTHEDTSMYEDHLDFLNKDTKAVEAELLRSQLGILKDMQDEVDLKIKQEKEKKKRDEEYKQKLLEARLETDGSEKIGLEKEKSEWFDQRKKDETESESESPSEETPISDDRDKSRAQKFVETRRRETKIFS